MTRYEIKIENIVATTKISDGIDIKELSNLVKGKIVYRYYPGKFPGLVLKIFNPKVSFLVFSTGSVVCTGSRSIEDIKLALNKLIKILKSLGLNVNDNPEIKIRNIVAVVDLGVNLNLNKLALALGENVEYEPEQFPSLVYSVNNKSVLIFNTGRIIIPGCRSVEEIDEIVNKLTKLLRNLGFI